MLTAMQIETTVDTLAETIMELEDRLTDLADRGFPLLDKRRVTIQIKINELGKIITRLNSMKRAL